MQQILVVNSSLNGEQGNSNKLTAALAEKLAARGNTSIIQRDLNSETLPHLSGQEMQAWMTDVSERTPEQQLLAGLSDNLLEEVQQADTLVLGVPMYNFGVPSVFKAWIDRIARAGVTFRYTENGPVGLLTDKKVIVIAARGGMYAGTEKDSQSQFLKDVLAFLGLTDVEFIYAEGFAMGNEGADNSWKQADEKMLELFDKVVA